MTRITLKWMNIIREQRAKHKSDKEVLANVFAWGLKEEKTIEKRFSQQARTNKKKEERAKKRFDNFIAETERFVYELKEEWRTMKEDEGKTKINVKMTPLKSSNG